MTRINVYRPTIDPISGYDNGQVLDGWFDDASADAYSEDTRWDGNNHISVNTGSQWNHEMLYRTKGGRWVLHWWSQWQGSAPSYRYIGDDAAREWLITNGEDGAVARWFGEVEDERGPGRPAVGQAINIRLGDDLLAQVDSRAADEGVSRAEMIRRLVSAGV